MKKLWREAAGEFVEAIIYTGTVHIDTGMSAASAVPLAKEAKLGSAIQSFISASANGPKRGAFGMDGKFRKELWRSMKAGRQAGESSYILKFGSFSNQVFTFRFDIKVWQWKYNEGQWGAIPYGEQRFKDYIKRNLKSRIPKLSKYITTIQS